MASLGWFDLRTTDFQSVVPLAATYDGLPVRRSYYGHPVCSTAFGQRQVLGILDRTALKRLKSLASPGLVALRTTDFQSVVPLAATYDGLLVRRSDYGPPVRRTAWGLSQFCLVN